MSEVDNLVATAPSKTLKLQKIDIKKLQMQHDELQGRLNSLKELLIEKDHLVKSQRTTIKLQEEKISQQVQNTDTLRHIIHILSKHITDVLKETLPVLPPLPQDHLINVDSLLAASVPKKRRKSNKRLHSSVDLKDTYSSRNDLDSNHHKRANLYDFNGAEILNSIADLQEARRTAQQAARAQGRYTIVTSQRVSLFETLSFFLTLRNVAFLNNFEIFFPRVLEMLTDLIDVERVIVYIYDDEQLYSMAMTGDITKQLVIPKGFSHLFYAIEQPIIIPQAYEDSRFDMRYDQISGFKTNNLACFPIKLGEEFIGIFECANKKNEFIKEDIIMLTLITKQLALGIAGNLYKENDINSHYIPRENNMPSNETLVFSSLKSVAYSIKSFVVCELVSFYVISNDKTELSCIASTDNIQAFKVSLNYSFPGLCFTSKKGITLINAQDHSMYNPDVEKKLGITSKEIMLLPLGQLGVVECINKSKGFSSRDEAKAANIAIIAKNLLEAGLHLEDLLDGCDINEDFCDHIHQSLICVNSNGIIKKANLSAALFFDIPKEKIIGASFTQLFEGSEEILKYVIRLKGKNSQKIEVVVIKDKTVSVDIIPSRNNFILIIEQTVPR